MRVNLVPQEVFSEVANSYMYKNKNYKKNNTKAINLL